jgi:hypothetical protein
MFKVGDKVRSTEAPWITGVVAEITPLGNCHVHADGDWVRPNIFLFNQKELALNEPRRIKDK